LGRHRCVGHAGGTRCGASQLVWLPQKRGVLAFALNTLAAFDVFTTRMLGDFSHAIFGVSAPTLVLPKPPLRIDNCKRFVGTYVRNGMRYEIREKGGRLHYQETYLGLGVPGEVLGVVVEGDLTSLGGDRFLVMRPAPAYGIPIASFGDDGQGRAANLVVPNFATRRVNE
jgi:hypothetical protein